MAVNQSQADYIKTVQMLRGLFSAASYSSQFSKLLEWLMPNNL